MGYNSISFSVILILQLIPNAILWLNHDISTLKLLQVVHRHGDRVIEEHWFPNDPFKNYSQYWPEGEGQLTHQGKTRMYGIGQFIREHYQSYLGNQFSPREVYARSSAKPRCLESAQLVLSGAYPPNNTDWQWSSDAPLASVWQPVPIESFIPMDDDLLLRVEAHCPAAEEGQQRVYHSQEVLDFLDTEREFITQLEGYMGRKFEDIQDLNDFWDTFRIESERGYKWSDQGLFDEAFQNITLLKTTKIATFYWQVKYSDPILKRLRAGPLLDRLNTNFLSSIAGNVTQKVMFYSTHDLKLSAIMHLLDVNNGQLWPFGATLFFELHRKPEDNSHFVRIYFFNETLSAMSPHLLELPECDHLSDCPIDSFSALTDKLIPRDWNQECNSSLRHVFRFELILVVLSISAWTINTKHV